MTRLDRAALFSLTGILSVILALLVLGEAQFPLKEPGRFHLPWGALDLRDLTFEHLKVVQLGGLLLSLAVLVWPLERMGRGAQERLARFGCVMLLILVTLGTTMVMAKHVMKRNAYFDYYDTYHYLLGARYFDELGYDQHYTCTVVALEDLYRKREIKRRSHPPKIRDLATNKHVAVDKKFFKSRHAKRCRQSFSPERWQQFGREVAWFRDWFGDAHWRYALGDHGYNGPPPLTSVTRLLSDGVSIDKANLIYLGTFNLIVLFGMAMCAVWAFGWRLGLGFFAFLWMCPVDKFHTIPAFIRYLWLASLVSSFSMMKKGRYALAGAMIGISACMKIFPAVFLLPMVWRSLLSFRENGSWEVHQRRFFLGAFAAAVVLLLLSGVYGGGVSGWRGFLEQMDLNAHRFSGGRIGFVYNFLYPKAVFENVGSLSSATFSEPFLGPLSMKHVRWAVTVPLLFLAVRATRRWDDVSATIFLGFCLHFLCLNAVRYYYTGFLGLMLMCHAMHEGPGRLRARSLWTALFGISIAALLLEGPFVETFIFNTLYPAFFTAYIIAVVILNELPTLPRYTPRSTEPKTASISVPI